MTSKGIILVQGFDKPIKPDFEEEGNCGHTIIEIPGIVCPTTNNTLVDRPDLAAQIRGIKPVFVIYEPQVHTALGSGAPLSGYLEYVESAAADVGALVIARTVRVSSDVLVLNRRSPHPIVYTGLASFKELVDNFERRDLARKS